MYFYIKRKLFIFWFQFSLSCQHKKKNKKKKPTLSCFTGMPTLHILNFKNDVNYLLLQNVPEMSCALIANTMLVSDYLIITIWNKKKTRIWIAFMLSKRKNFAQINNLSFI